MNKSNGFFQEAKLLTIKTAKDIRFHKIMRTACGYIWMLSLVVLAFVAIFISPSSVIRLPLEQAQLAEQRRLDGLHHFSQVLFLFVTVPGVIGYVVFGLLSWFKQKAESKGPKE